MCFCRHLHGINVRGGERGGFSSSEGMALAAGSGGERKPVQAVRFKGGALLLEKVLHGMPGEADSLACSRKFILPDRRHGAKKRN